LCCATIETERETARRAVDDRDRGVEQIEAAVAAAAKGPCDLKALERIAAVQRSFAGEPR
jgi:hypothetical protein